MSIFKRTPKQKPAPTDVDEVKAVDVTEAKKPVAKRAAKAETTPKPTTGKMVSAFTAKTLLAPLVTEKAAHLADAGVYAFLVPVTANRVAVGQAFRELYKVTPVKVNIIRVHGKEHRFSGVTSRQSDWKKALIAVPKGTRIDIFEKL